MMGQNGFLTPAGPLLGASQTYFWVFVAATMAMVVASIVLAVTETVRTRTLLPIVVFLSGAVWLPNEPFVDAVIGFQYASDSPVILFTLAGRPIPLVVLGVGAMFFIFTWILYRMIIAGRSVRQITAVAVVAGIIDWPLEWLASYFHVFEYYGHDPARILGMPITSMVQNCFLYVFMAAVLVLCRPYLTGWRTLLFLPVLPGCYYAVAFLCTWPAYLALHGNWPTAVFLPLALISAAMNAYIPLALLRIVRDRLTAGGPSGAAATPVPAPVPAGLGRA